MRWPYLWSQDTVLMLGMSVTQVSGQATTIRCSADLEFGDGHKLVISSAAILVILFTPFKWIIRKNYNFSVPTGIAFISIISKNPAFSVLLKPQAQLRHFKRWSNFTGGPSWLLHISGWQQHWTRQINNIPVLQRVHLNRTTQGNSFTNLLKAHVKLLPQLSKK